MKNSFQNEIPKARVNITLDLHVGDSIKKIELPLNLLTIGNYSGNNIDSKSMIDKKKVNITKQNFDFVVNKVNPKLSFCIDNRINNKGNLKIDLSFKNLKSFSPDAVAQQVPALKNLLAVRNLLKDLKSNLIDDVKLKSVLNSIIAKKSDILAIQNDLRQLSKKNDD